MLLTEEIDATLTGVTQMNTPPSIMERVIANVVSGMATPHSNQVCFRASSIGKPWILQVLGRWYPSEPVFSVSACMKMLDGIVAQAWAEEILGIAGFDFQREREYRLMVGDTEVVGHSDIVVTNHASRQISVIECKSMAGHIFTKFWKTPHDDYGYLSQLSFYTSMVRRENPTYKVEPVFLLFDRSLGQFKTIVISDQVIEAKFNRVESALIDVAAIPMFDLVTLMNTVMIPPPIGGKIPPSMQWSKWSKCFYYEGEGREVKLHTAETSVKLLNNMTQNKLGGL